MIDPDDPEIIRRMCNIIIDSEQVTKRVLRYLSKHSPGKLLASFKTEVMFRTKTGELGINLPLEVQNKLISKRVDTNITVLILEGSEVKNGS